MIPQLTNAANTADPYQMVGGQRPVRGRRPLWRPEVFRRAKPCRRRTLRLGYSFSRQALAKPCRRQTLRLGRRPTVQRQSTGTAMPPSVSTQDSIPTLRHAYLSHFFYILLSLYLYLCVSLFLSLSQSLTLPHTESLSHTERRRDRNSKNCGGSGTGNRRLRERERVRE